MAELFPADRPAGQPKAVPQAGLTAHERATETNRPVLGDEPNYMSTEMLRSVPRSFMRNTAFTLGGLSGLASDLIAMPAQPAVNTFVPNPGRDDLQRTEKMANQPSHIPAPGNQSWQQNLAAGMQEPQNQPMDPGWFGGSMKMEQWDAGVMRGLESVIPGTRPNQDNLARMSETERKNYEGFNAALDFGTGFTMGGGAIGTVRGARNVSKAGEAADAAHDVLMKPTENAPGLVDQIAATGRNTVTGAAKGFGKGVVESVGPTTLAKYWTAPVAGSFMAAHMADWDPNASDVENADNIRMYAALGSLVGVAGQAGLRWAASHIWTPTSAAAKKAGGKLKQNFDAGFDDALSEHFDDDTVAALRASRARLEKALTAGLSDGTLEADDAQALLTMSAAIMAHGEEGAKHILPLLKKITEHHPELRRDLADKIRDARGKMGEIDENSKTFWEKAVRDIESGDDADTIIGGAGRVYSQSDERDYARAFRGEFKKNEAAVRADYDKRYEALREEGKQYKLEPAKDAEDGVEIIDDAGESIADGGEVIEGGTEISKSVVGNATKGMPEDVSKTVETLFGEIDELPIGHSRQMYELLNRLDNLHKSGGEMTAATLMTMVQRLNQIKRTHGSADANVANRIDDAIATAKNRFYNNDAIPQRLKDDFAELQEGWRDDYATMFQSRQFSRILKHEPASDANVELNTAGMLLTGKGSMTIDPAHYDDAIKMTNPRDVNRMMGVHFTRRFQNADGTLNAKRFSKFLEDNSDFFMNGMRKNPDGTHVYPGRERLLEGIMNRAGKLSYQKLVKPGPNGESTAMMIDNMEIDELAAALKGVPGEGDAAKKYIRARLFHGLADMNPAERVKLMRRLNPKAQTLIDNGVMSADDWDNHVAMAEVQESLLSELSLGAEVKGSGPFAKAYRAFTEKMESATGRRVREQASFLRQIIFRFRAGGTVLAGTYIPGVAENYASLVAYNTLFKEAFKSEHVVAKMFNAAKMFGGGDTKGAYRQWIGALNAVREAGMEGVSDHSKEVFDHYVNDLIAQYEAEYGGGGE